MLLVVIVTALVFTNWREKEKNYATNEIWIFFLNFTVKLNSLQVEATVAIEE